MILNNIAAVFWGLGVCSSIRGDGRFGKTCCEFLRIICSRQIRGSQSQHLNSNSLFVQLMHTNIYRTIILPVVLYGCEN